MKITANFAKAGIGRDDSVFALYHTSPEPITCIHDQGLFGKYIFFSNRPYVMYGNGQQHETYAIKHADAEGINTIDCCRFEYMRDDEIKNIIKQLNGSKSEFNRVVKDVKNHFSVDNETALSLLSESTQIYDLDNSSEFDYEDSFWLQHASARLAHSLGFDGVQITDEQGTATLLNIERIEKVLFHLKDTE